MKTSRVVIVLVLAISGLGCGGSDPQKEEVIFEFRLHGLDNSEAFRVKLNTAETIAATRAQLSLPEEERRLFPIGGISPGNGGVNLQWSWHFSDVRLTEVSIELCDGTPSLVEADLYYWTNTVTLFCPWQAYVYAEVDQVGEQSQVSTEEAGTAKHLEPLQSTILNRQPTRLRISYEQPTAFAF